MPRVDYGSEEDTVVDMPFLNLPLFFLMNSHRINSQEIVSQVIFRFFCCGLLLSRSTQEHRGMNSEEDV